MINPLLVLHQSSLEWSHLVRSRYKLSQIVTYLLIMPLLPSIAWFYGSTQVGWQSGGSQTVKLAFSSGLLLCIGMYIALLSMNIFVGSMMHWMAKTYGSNLHAFKGVAFSSFISSPFFLLGVCGFYPMFWLDVALLFAAIVWSVHILYSRMAAVANISDEQAFIFSSAVVAVGIVAFISMVVVSVLFMGLVQPPVFID
ncbi:MAG: Yip1 family protein [Cellvibrionales bacterium]|nr:Yip1 family protein [Cellvibrionales bacterium]